jgi:hypothetical protein
MEGHNWFLNQFVEIQGNSIIVCFLSLSAKAGFNLPPVEISCSWFHFGPAVPTKIVLCDSSRVRQQIEREDSIQAVFRRMRGLEGLLY